MKVTILPGDGIGPEVTEAAVKVLTTVAEFHSIPLSLDWQRIGGSAIREDGNPFPDATREACVNSDAVFLGAVGDPSFDHLPPSKRPEGGLLEMRRALGGFANLRPAKALPALISASPLRRDVFEGTDLLIVRELLGGIYFGQPRGVDEDGLRAYNTMAYSVSEIERVARVAFEAARRRRKKLASVDKANVLETSQLWRATVANIAKDYPDVEVENLYVDACAMHLVTDPKRFDVILTENMFGDILSDEAAVLTGSLGTLPSATIGGNVDLYEPIHGSAPAIAGKNIANPIGAIASVAMMFRYTGNRPEIAEAIERSIDEVVEEGYRTIDIIGDTSNTEVSTSRMGELIAGRIVDVAELNHYFHAV
jgi:3-isopropylmalate dehydrogenase